MKKLNAVIAWLATLTLLGHLATMTYSLLTGWYDYVLCKALAYATVITVGGHVLITLVIFLFLHDGSSLGRYAKLNAKTIEQRVSALAILVLLHAHVRSFGFIVAGEPLGIPTKAFIIVAEALLFTAIFSHLVTSLPRSLITLGLIRDDEAEERATRVLSRMSVILLALTCIALARFVILWPTA